MKNLWNNDSFLKILSLALACATWFYIMIFLNPVVDRKFNSIPVTTVSGQALDERGLMIYDMENQDVHAGGSGCGCSAATFAAYFYKQLKQGEIKRLLLVPTGALHSVATIQQGESIPAIAHAVAIEGKIR